MEADEEGRGGMKPMKKFDDRGRQCWSRRREKRKKRQRRPRRPEEADGLKTEADLGGNEIS